MKLSRIQSAELVGFVARSEGRARAVITGTSMWPLLRAGMVIDVKPFSGEPRIGDIIVFKARKGLVAHRFVGDEGLGVRDEPLATLVTAGDAYPHQPELVPRALVLGRVSAVWSSSAPDAKRVDDAWYRTLGKLFARTRRMRALVRRSRKFAAFIVARPEHILAQAAFAQIAAATRAFERGRWSDGVAHLCSVPQSSVIDTARRHHASGLIAGWLDDAVVFGTTVPSEMHEAFRRIRYTNALQAGRILACTRDVRDRLAAASIPYILLKGGARISSADTGAELHFSGDLDVLVPTAEVDRAVHVLRDAGYRELFDEVRSASFRLRVHHHEAPLCSPAVEVPVEIHRAIAPAPLVSQYLDYEALFPFSELKDGPIGEVRVLDEVASAVHLAYHARDLLAWRDIVLLSRILRSLSPRARRRFDAFMKGEKQDRVRLMSAVAVADGITMDAPRPPRPVRRYLSWAMFRENLPVPLNRNDLLETFFGRCLVPQLRLDTGEGAWSWPRLWVRDLLLMPAIMRIAVALRVRSLKTQI